jgi:general secretion pathway protein C
VTDGVSLYGVRRDSLLAQAGIENGDVVHAVDGVTLSDPNVALEAYARLRQGGTARLTILRRGQPIELVYEIEGVD